MNTEFSLICKVMKQLEFILTACTHETSKLSIYKRLFNEVLILCKPGSDFVLGIKKYLKLQMGQFFNKKVFIPYSILLPHCVQSYWEHSFVVKYVSTY